MKKECYMLVGKQSEQDEVELELFEDENDARDQANLWIQQNKYTQDKIFLIKTFLKQSSKKESSENGPD